MLSTVVRVFRNPYPHCIPDRDFCDLLTEIAEEAALEIEERHGKGEYKRDSMGFVIMDPTTPPSMSSEEAVLTLIAIGPTGMEFVPNGAAKAFEHRETGVNCGVLVYTQNHRLADGSFRYGHSVNIDGTIVGASGETELQDRLQATRMAATFNYRVGQAREKWEKVKGEGRWYCDENLPASRYSEIVDWEAVISRVSS